MKSKKINKSQKPGIYIHIPFCERKCGYCDFYSITNLDQKEPFIKALLLEIATVGQKLAANDVRFDTIYFGGGTPSLLTPKELERILHTVKKWFAISDDCEITLEANPGAVIKTYLHPYKELGVNRLSIGIQSFNAWELKFLERIHSVQEAEQTFAAARESGFDNIGIDLMYALPEQTKKHWQYSLQKGVDLQPEHISAYNLIFEAGTPIFARKERGELRPKTEEEEFDFFIFTNEFLEAHGYLAYEVSNFAKSPRFYSRHNYKYWQHVPYLGFGPSAHSFWQKRRWANVRSLPKYLTALNNKTSPVNFEETISAKTEEFEHIFLRLRTYEGLNITYFEQQFNRSFFDSYRKIVNILMEMEYAQYNAPYFRLTKKGMAVCDEILSYFS